MWDAIIALLRRTGIMFSIRFSWTGDKEMAVYFTDEEIKGLDKELVAKLDTARKAAGIPFRITSGLRTCAANDAVLGVEGSAHLKGLAVDLAVESGSDRFLIVKALLASGFVRIGAYTNHVHCDLDPEKPQNVLWIGVSH